MVDEMDLVSQLKEAAPLRPEAYEQARATLRAAMAETGPEVASVPGLSRARSRRRAMGTRGKIGIGAGIGAVAAAAAAITLVATSTPQPAAPAASGSQSTPASSPLISLAAYIQANEGPLAGNATLLITHKSSGEVVWELITDGGADYPGDSKATVLEAIAQHADVSGGMNAGDVKAALFAAKGNLTAAREEMATVGPGDGWLFLTGAAQKAAWEKGAAQAEQILKEKGVKTPLKMPTGKALQAIIDNRIWDNSVQALTAGAGNPEVRAGVLRLLSTISAVTVADSTTGGVPTLTITAGPEVLGGSGEQVVTVNAKTGMPMESVAKGGPTTSVYTYTVKRVTLEAGKF